MSINCLLRLSVRLIKSSRAGMGKSLIVKRLTKQLETISNTKKKNLQSTLCCTIPVHGVCVDSNAITRHLLSHTLKRGDTLSRIFHLDVSQSVSCTQSLKCVRGICDFLKDVKRTCENENRTSIVMFLSKM